MSVLSPHYFHHEDDFFPPYPETRADVNPTLLVSWWCTLFSFVIILIRLGGRWIRTETLFTEDRIMALAIIPLFARMICVHFVLKYGTNNVVITNLTDEDIAERVVGSKLVLPARIFYIMFIWIAKLTIADFLHRIYSQMWTKKHNFFLKLIRWFLGLTFIGLFISTLAECQPFHAYWQVKPDPGPSCRASYSQLITMGVFDSITDIILVAFPLPIIFSSNMKFERKVSLSLLFSMSLILVGITIYRVQATIEHHYDQRFRSLLASFEIFAATGVANAIVLGSFLRDRGVKKNKFRHSSTGHDSVLDRPSNAVVSARSHPAAHAAQQAASTLGARHVRGLHSWGSDIDLVGDLGIRLGPEFHAEKKPRLARPAPAALPMVPLRRDGRPRSQDWKSPTPGDLEEGGGLRNTDLDSDNDEGEDDNAYDSDPPSPKTPFTPKVDFFDVGGLLSPLPGAAANGSKSMQNARGRRRRTSSVSFAPLPNSSSSNTPLSPSGLNDAGNGSVDNSPALGSLFSPTRSRYMPRERLANSSGLASGLSVFNFQKGPKSPKSPQQDGTRSLNFFRFPTELTPRSRNPSVVSQARRNSVKPPDDVDDGGEDDKSPADKDLKHPRTN